MTSVLWNSELQWNLVIINYPKHIWSALCSVKKNVFLSAETGQQISRCRYICDISRTCRMRSSLTDPKTFMPVFLCSDGDTVGWCTLKSTILRHLPGTEHPFCHSTYVSALNSLWLKGCKSPQVPSFLSSQTVINTGTKEETNLQACIESLHVLVYI